MGSATNNADSHHNDAATATSNAATTTNNAAARGIWHQRSVRRMLLTSMGPLLILAVAAGGFIIYKIATSERAAPRAIAPTPVPGTSTQTSTTTPAARTPGAPGEARPTYDGTLGSRTTPPTTSAGAPPTIDRSGPVDRRLGRLVVDISEDRRLGIEALPDTGAGSPKPLVRSMILTYESAKKNGTLALFPWDVEFIRQKADTMVNEFGATRVAQTLRNIANAVEAAVALNAAKTAAEEEAALAAVAVARATANFPAIMALPDGKLANELKSIALHLEWRARLTNASIDDSISQSDPYVTTGVGYILAVPSGVSYVPPSGAQMIDLYNRTSAAFGSEAPVTKEVLAIRMTIEAGSLVGASSSGGGGETDYGQYIDAAEQIVDAAGNIPTSGSVSVTFGT